MTTDELVLRAGAASAVLAAEGGRLTSLQVDGFELLIGPDADPMRWGSYAMAPWAGRIRHGRFTFAGVDHQLPIVVPPHAIHGTAYLRPWTVDGESLRIDLGDGWPFAGTLTQEIELHDDRLVDRGLLSRLRDLGLDVVLFAGNGVTEQLLEATFLVLAHGRRDRNPHGVQFDTS